jgi:branched-chain amino acid transport system permease protein
MPDIAIELIQCTVDGALQGLAYAMVAMGFIIVFRAGRILNLALGEVVIIGAFIVYSCVSLPLVSNLTIRFLGEVPGWLMLSISLSMSVAAIALFGLVIERLVFRPLIGQSIFTIIMATVGLMILLKGLVLAVWGADDLPFPSIFSMKVVRIGPFSFERAFFWGGISSIGIFAGLWFLFEKTRWGLKLTAVAEDHTVSQAMGISVQKAIAIAWILGSLLSGWGGIIFLNGQTLTYTAGAIGLAALPVALLAGLESIWGAPIAGIIIGVGEALAAAYLDEYTGGVMSEAFPFLIMLIVLLIRPQGLFGWKIIERI